MKLNNNFKKWNIALSLAASLVLLNTAAHAAKQGHLKVTSKVQKMVIVNQNGQKRYQFTPAKKVLPGETVQYNTFFQNISNKPASNINIVNAIPKHTVFLPNSVQGQGTRSQFSVDGGRHYGNANTLKVRGRDGKLYPAKPADYTHIRWQYMGHLAPKAQKSVGFRVRLK